MGLGTEILFILMLGLLILGPKQMHTMLAHVARAKAQFEKASRGFKSQLAAELDATPVTGETDRLNPAADVEYSSNSVNMKNSL